MPELIPIPRVAAALPHFEQYVGAWAITPEAMRAAISMARSMDLEGHIEARKAAGVRHQASGKQEAGFGGDFYTRTAGGVGVIRISGAMTKYGSSLSECAPTVELRRAVRSAASDAMVKGIALFVESPGGQSAGIDDLARDIFNAAQVKPVIAYIEDLGASASYYAACQATRVVANAAALVGSIGTYTVLTDYSAVAEAQGVKVHVVRSGAFKGMGEEGTAITDEELSEVQRIVDSINGLFLGAVARGRGMSDDEVQRVADGRVFIASEALEMGLIDEVGTFEGVIEELEKQGPGTGHQASGLIPDPRSLIPSSSTKEHHMAAATTPARGRAAIRNAAAEEPEKKPEEEDPEGEAAKAKAEAEKPKDEEAPAASSAGRKPQAASPATLAELKSKFPDSTAEFREECQIAGLTMEQATDKFMNILRAKAASAPAPGAQRKAGHEPVGTNPGVQRQAGAGAGGAQGDDAKAQIDTLVAEKMKATGKPRHLAHQDVMRENPELREAWIESHNQQHKSAAGAAR